jgi:hypothetical protein
MSTPAGWYPDPDDASQMRYWDGASWTADFSPAEANEPTIPLPTIDVAAPTPPGPTAKPDPLEPWYRKKLVWGAAAAVLVIGAIGAAMRNDDAKPASTPTRVVTVTATPAPAPTTVVTVTATPIPTPSGQPTDSQVGNNPPAADGRFIMPDERGKNLQASQDDLQAITGNPFYYSGSNDATGAGRFQILDSGWQVCSQKPAPGTNLSVDYDGVVFNVVRNSETCP